MKAALIKLASGTKCIAYNKGKMSPHRAVLNLKSPDE